MILRARCRPRPLTSRAPSAPPRPTAAQPARLRTTRCEAGVASNAFARIGISDPYAWDAVARAALAIPRHR